MPTSRPALLAAAIVAALTIASQAQTKAPPAPADFGKWETLVSFPRGGLSPDGRWMAYGINRSNRNNEIRIASVAGGSTRTAAFGSQVTFSADSQWAAYAIGASESQEEKLRKEKKPIQRKLGIVHLEDGATTTVDAIESFAFDASGSHLALKRYAPERKEQQKDQQDQPGSDDDQPRGATLIVRELKTARDTTFGNVSEFVWQDKGRLLAFAIAADDKTGNGAQLFDPSNGSLRSLDSSAAIYSGLTWRKDADDLAVLRSKDDEHRDGPTQVALAWRDLTDSAARPVVFDPTATSGVPAGMRTVGYRRPSWSDDGHIVFVGIAAWNEKPPNVKKKKDTNGDGDGESETEEAAAVDVWHPHDIDVMPRQKLNARSDRQRSILSAWHLDSNRLVPLGKEPLERITPIRHTKLAYAVNWTAYAMDRSIGRPAADLYLVDLDSGARTKVQDRIEDQYLQAGPAGRYL